jgi:putative heme-binding domain-containing protein
LRDIRNPAVMSQLGHFTSACGQSIYSGGGFPAPYLGAYFICEPVHNLVHCDRLTARGGTFRASRMLDEAEFLASRDSWFMPVFTTTGPDGALYVADFYRKIVEHPEWIREDLKDEQKLFYAGTDRGRIYRVVHDGMKRGPAPRLGDAAGAELVRHLSDPNGWVRITAQRLLVERADRSPAAELRRLAAGGASAEGRMHALWTLEGLDALDAGLVLRALDDSSPAVREQALRLAEQFLPEARLGKKLAGMIADPDSHVRFQLACTLGELPAAQSFAPLRELAARHIEDPWFQIAALTAAKENAGQWFAAAIRDSRVIAEPSEARQAFLRRIAGILGARRKDAEIGAVIAAAGRTSTKASAWWQVASLRGLAEGLRRAPAGRKDIAAGQQQAVLQLLEAPGEAMRGAALEVAAAIHLEESAQLNAVVRRASRRFLDPRSGPAVRVQAAAVLGLDPSRSSLPLLESAFSPKQPEEVQLAAARALLGIPGARSTAALLKNWNGQTAAVRDVVLTGFLRDSDRVAALVSAMESGVVQPASLSRAARQRLTRVRDEGIRKRAAALFSGLSNDRAPVVEKYRAAAAGSGNSGRGLEVFRRHCSDCHKLGDIGLQVGPDLLTLTNQSKDELLSNILDPNASIAAGYEEYLVQTADGRMITGVIANQNATSVTLRRSKGEEDTVLRSAISEMRALTVSSMPENLEEGISLEQMKDLLEYLKTAGAPKTARRQSDAR